MVCFQWLGHCRTLWECMNVRCDPTRNKNKPFEVVVGHVEVFQREQEIVESLAGDFDQLVVVDN